MYKIPIACDLEVFDQSEKRLHDELLMEAMTGFQNVKELSDGYQFSFIYNDQLIKKIEDWITLESRCCPFFRFKLESDKTKNSINLHITGPEGVKQILKAAMILK